MKVNFLINNESDLGKIIQEYRNNHTVFCGRFAEKTDINVVCSIDFTSSYDSYTVIDSSYNDSYPENQLITQILLEMIRFLVKENAIL